MLLTTLIIYQKRPIKIPKEISYLALFVSIGLLDISAFFSYSLGVMGEYASIVAPIGGTFTMVTILLARLFLKEGHKVIE